MIKTDRYVQTEAGRNVIPADSGYRGNYPLCNWKEEIKGNDSLIIEKKEYPAVEFAKQRKTKKSWN